MAELADALVLGSSVIGVRVRIPFRAPIANANPTEYSGENPPGRVFPRADSAVKVVCVICVCSHIGVSPSRLKASDFDSDIRRFESVYPNHFVRER